MKKAVKKAAVMGLAVSVIFLIIFGIYGKKQISQAGGTGIQLDEAALQNRLDFIAEPALAGTGSFANSMFMMNSVLSDACTSGESGWGKIRLDTLHAILDKNGNIIRSGAIAVAETEKCFLDEYKSCTDYNTSYGLIDITRAFNEVQLSRLSEEMLQNRPALRIDSYYMSGTECIPVQITVLLADKPMYIFNCNVPQEFTDLQPTVDAPLWIHEPYKIDWKGASELVSNDELLDWCRDNTDLMFQTSEAASAKAPAGSATSRITSDIVDMTSVFSGPKSISFFADGQYALVFLQQIDCNSFLWTAIFRALCIGGGLFIAVLLLSLLKNRRR